MPITPRDRCPYMVVRVPVFTLDDALMVRAPQRQTLLALLNQNQISQHDNNGSSTDYQETYNNKIKIRR